MFPRKITYNGVAFLKKAKGFLIKPSKMFNNVKTDTINDTLKYYGILLLIYSSISFIIRGDDMLVNIIFFVITIFQWLFLLFVVGVFLHLAVYALGSRVEFTQTIKVVAYSLTPAFLFGWLLNLSIDQLLSLVLLFIISAWTFALVLFGLRQLHLLSMGRAIASMIVSVIIGIPLLTLIFSGTMLFL